jgi:hypothetical protein
MEGASFRLELLRAVSGGRGVDKVRAPKGICCFISSGFWRTVENRTPLLACIHAD